MQNKYCNKCSQPTPFSDNPPAFCSKCGNPFSTLNIPQISTSSVKIKPKLKRIVQQEIEDDDEEYQGEIPQISKIEIEPLGNLRQTEKLKTIAFDRSAPEVLNRPKNKKVKKEQFLNDWAADIKKGGRNVSENIGGEN
jgi:hypothetical protein